MEKTQYPSEALERFIVRLPDGMRAQIAEAARLGNRSMNAEIVTRLQSTFQNTANLTAPGFELQGGGNITLPALRMSTPEEEALAREIELLKGKVADQAALATAYQRYFKLLASGVLKAAGELPKSALAASESLRMAHQVALGFLDEDEDSDGFHQFAVGVTRLNELTRALPDALEPEQPAPPATPRKKGKR